jgi:hypothetical protein
MAVGGAAAILRPDLAIDLRSALSRLVTRGHEPRVVREEADQRSDLVSIHPHPGPRRVAALGLVALMAAACSGSATNPTISDAPLASNAPVASNAPLASTAPAASEGASGSTDPCALVTSAEAQAAIGVPVATVKRKDQGQVQVCEYTSADGRTDLVLTLYERVGAGEDSTSFEAAFAGQPVSGVGSDARVNADLSGLAVLQNGTVVDVAMSNPVGSAGAAQIQAALTKVAIAALGRL